MPGDDLLFHRLSDSTIGASLVSRPSSGWDRVVHKRYSHQAMKAVHIFFQIDGYQGLRVFDHAGQPVLTLAV